MECAVIRRHGRLWAIRRAPIKVRDAILRRDLFAGAET
jgi:hypothetical protein